MYLSYVFQIGYLHCWTELGLQGNSPSSLILHTVTAVQYVLCAVGLPSLLYFWEGSEVSPLPIYLVHNTTTVRSTRLYILTFLRSPRLLLKCTGMQYKSICKLVSSTRVLVKLVCNTRALLLLLYVTSRYVRCPARLLDIEEGGGFIKTQTKNTETARF